MASNKVLDIIIEAHDKASKQIEGVRKQVETLNQVGANMRDVGTNFMAVGASVGAALGYAIKTTGDFEQAVANAGSVMGRSAGDWKDIEQVARDYGKTTTYSATESAGAIQMLAQYGYDLSDAQKMMATTTKLATGQQYDLGMTTDIVVSTLKNFEKQGYTTAQVGDILAQSSNISSASMEKFRYSLKYVSPVANALGISLEDMTAQLSALYDAGMPAETAGTALRMSYNRLLNPTKAAAAALESYGISVKDVNPQTHKMADILDTLNKAGVSTNDVFKIFGVETAPAMLAMMQQGGDAIRKYESQLTKSSGTVEKMYKTQMSTFNNQVKMLKSGLEDAAISIGNALLPVLKQLVAGLQTATDWFNGLSDGTKKVAAYAILAGAGLTIAAGMILYFGGAFLTAMASMRMFLTYVKMFKELTVVARGISLLGAAINTLKGILGVAGRAFLTFSRLLLTNPIGIAITLIIAAVVLLYTAWTHNWGGIQEKTAAVWAWLKSAGSSLISWFSSAWDTALAAIKNFGTWMAQVFTNLWTTIKNFFVGVYNDAVAWVQQVPAAIQNGWNTLVSWFTSFGQTLKSTIYNFLLGILTDTGQTQEEAKQTIQNAWNNIKTFFSTIWTAIRFIFFDAWVALGQAVANGVQTVWGWIQSGFSQVASFVTNIWNTIQAHIQVAWGIIVRYVMTYLRQLYTNWMSVWNQVKSVASSVWSAISSVISSAWNRVSSLVKSGLSTLSSLWSSIWNRIKSVASSVWSAIKSVVKSGISNAKSVVQAGLTALSSFWKGIWNTIKSVVQVVWSGIKSIAQSGINIVKNLIAAGLNLLAGNWKKAWNNLKTAVKEGMKLAQTAVKTGLKAIVTAIKGFFGTVKSSGGALMEAFAKGIKGAVGKVTGAVKGVLGEARKYFGFSDAKKGPFSNITHSGFATLSAFAKGVRSSKNMLSKSVGGTLQGALSGASVGNLTLGSMSGSGLMTRQSEPQTQQQAPTIHIHVNGGEKHDPKEIANEVMREINRQLKR
jgi:TP901 family phage tail tape measure protein